MLFNYFEGSNKGIVGREAEMRGSMIKCGERPLEGGGCEILVRLPMDYGAMETVEYMGVDIWCLLGWIMSQDCRNEFPWHELLN